MERLDKIVLKFQDLHVEAKPFYEEYCNITEKTPEKRRQKWVTLSDKVWKTIKDETVNIILVHLEAEEVLTKLVSEEWIHQQFGAEQGIQGGTLYFIFLEEKEPPEGTVLEKFYYEMWCSAVISAARGFIGNELSIEKNVSKSYAPGFDDISYNVLKEWLEIVDPAHTYATVNEHGVIEPSNSLLGVYYDR